MISEPSLIVRLRPATPRPGFLQTLAGETIWSDEPLTPFAWPGEALPVHAEPSPFGPGEEVVYDGPGELAGRIETIRSSRDGKGSMRIAYADGELFEISSATIRRSRPGPAPSAESSLERILGAPLALWLAARGTHLLHASAIGLPDGSAIAIVAPSGGGKSTLAGAAASQSKWGLERLADDQLPVRLAREAICLPQFPQLKLAGREQVQPTSPAARRLTSVVELRLSPTADRPRLFRLPAPQALEILVGATVAARLFDRARLGAHFSACAEAADLLPVHRLETPIGFDRLPESLRLLASLSP